MSVPSTFNPYLINLFILSCVSYASVDPRPVREKKGRPRKKKDDIEELGSG